MSMITSGSINSQIHTLENIESDFFQLNKLIKFTHWYLYDISDAHYPIRDP